MRVLHVGGYKNVTSELAEAQSNLGCECDCEFADFPSHFFERPAQGESLGERLSDWVGKKYDIIHFHRADTILFGQGPKSPPTLAYDALAKLYISGSRLFFSAYDHDLEILRSSLSYLDFDRILNGHLFEKVFVANLNGLEGATGNTCPVICPAYSKESLPNFTPHEPKARSIRILHIAHQVPFGDSEFITASMQELQTEKLRFTYQLRGPDELRTHEAVREAVQECEILIEQISRPGCGFLALEALALGKTVLSGNDPAVQQRFPHLLACPVLHATRENLTTRLRLVLREPKCLRDFGKRGRAYIERFHESNHVAKLVLQYYQRPTTRAATSAEQRGELSRH